MTALLEAFPDEFDLNIQRRMNQRFEGGGALMTFQQYFTVETTSQYQIKGDKYSSFQAMPAWPEGENVALYEAKKIWDVTFKQVGYGMGFRAGRHMVRYDRLQQVQRWADSLVDSGIATLRTKHASVLNNGFSTSYPAGGESSVALISASHPTEGSTVSNILAAASGLSVSALDNLRIVATNHVDYKGKKDPLLIDHLVVCPTDEKLASEISRSRLQPHTTDNQSNFFEGLVYTVEPYLTSTTAWFARDRRKRNLVSYHGLVYRTRRYMDEPSNSLVHVGEMDFVYGAEDWEGLFGSAGA